MKYLLIASVLFSCGQSRLHGGLKYKSQISYQASGFSLTTAHLKGKVKSVIACTYQASFNLDSSGLQKGNLIDSTISMYDRNGNMTEEHTSPNNRLTYVAKYNNAGKLEEEINYNQVGNKIIESRSSYSYDEKGAQIEEKDFDKKGTLQHSYTFKYDNNGNLIEKTTKDPAGNPEDKTVSKYDNNGYKTEDCTYFIDRGLMNRSVYSVGTDSSDIIVHSYVYPITSTSTSSYKQSNFDKFGNGRKLVISQDDHSSAIVEYSIDYY